MTQQLIVTTPANSGLGDSPKTAFDKCNANFSDLYSGSFTTGLPAAPSLAGTELVVVTAGGVAETATAAQIAALASPTPYAIQSDPNQSAAAFSAVGNFLNQLVWVTGVPSQTGGGPMNGASNTGQNTGWTTNSGTWSTQAANGSGTNLSSTIQMGILTSSAAANSGCHENATIFNSNGSNVNIFRVFSNNQPVAGFTMTLYFSFTTVLAGMGVFLGVCPGPTGLSGSQVPSALLNSMGLGKDSGDTNLSFYINGSSGSATKTSLGVSPSNLANQLLRLVITNDGLGNVTMTLTVMETTGGFAGQNYTITLPTATAKLPVANTQIEPQLYINNGGTASAVALGVAYFFSTVGFAGGG